MPSGHTEKNGPLTPTAIAALRSIVDGPIPRQAFNSGVARRLEREQLVEHVQLPSPYSTRKGDVTHLKITEAGRARLKPKRPYKVGDVVTVPRGRKDGPRPGRYTLKRRMGGRDSWEAQHEKLSWTIQLLEEEFTHGR